MSSDETKLKPRFRGAGYLWHATIPILNRVEAAVTGVWLIHGLVRFVFVVWAVMLVTVDERRDETRGER